MDEWSFALLSCKVFVRCYLADSAIYHKGETSDYAYIILGGSVKVRRGAAGVALATVMHTALQSTLRRLL